ncbi:MAG: hypothetical protein PHV36_03585 [Elusimicrobiales bacterium]|nr:hypothetical protein [Elusimicrobiales bacterium]
MKRLILTVLAAAGFSAAVSAREYAPGPAGASDRNARSEQAVIETVDPGLLVLETIEKLTPGADPMAPRITFALRNPDQTGAELSPADFSGLKDVAAWQVQILDSSGKKVDFIQGRRQPPPPVLSWSGLSGSGSPFPSGFYTARLVWTDRARKVYATQAVSFNLFSQLKMPDFAELKLDFRFSEELSLS